MSDRHYCRYWDENKKWICDVVDQDLAPKHYAYMTCVHETEGGESTITFNVDPRIHPHDGSISGIKAKERMITEEDKRDLDNLQAAYLLMSSCYDAEGAGLGKAMRIVKSRINKLQKDLGYRDEAVK